MVLNLFLHIFFYRGFFAPFEKHNPTGFISVLFLLLQLSPARRGKINWKQKSENAGKYGWYGQNVSLLKVGVKRAGGVIAGGNNFSAQFRFSVFVLMGLSRWAHQRCKKRRVDGVGGELIIKDVCACTSVSLGLHRCAKSRERKATEEGQKQR